MKIGADVMDIVQTIKSAFEGLNGDIQIITDIMTRNPESNNAIWSVITNIFNVILPVGYSLASLFFLIDFLNKATMFEYVKWENIVKSLLKLVVAKFFMERSFELLGLIFDIVSNIITTVGTNQINIENLIRIPEIPPPTNILEELKFSMQFLPVTVLMFIIRTAIKVIAYGRMIELYIYTAIAPIPLSTMTSESLHGTAKKFIQSYAGICLQGLIIIISCSVYTGLVAEFVKPSTGVEALNLNLWGLIMSGLVLLLILVKSGSWAKQITGGM